VRYNLYEKSFFGAQKIGSVKRPEAQLSDLTPGKKSTYVITAVDDDGLESDPGEPITVTGP
jgi:fibronectin type 3 domain-containing protein